MNDKESIAENLLNEFRRARGEYLEKHSFRGNSINSLRGLCSYFSGIALGLSIGNMITEEHYRHFDDIMWEIMESER